MTETKDISSQLVEKSTVIRLIRDAVTGLPPLTTAHKKPHKWLNRVESALMSGEVPKDRWINAIPRLIDEDVHEDWQTYLSSHHLDNAQWQNFNEFIINTYGGLKTAVDASLQFRHLVFDGNLQEFNNNYVNVVRRLGFTKGLEWVHIEYCFRLPDPIGSDTLLKNPQNLDEAIRIASQHSAWRKVADDARGNNGFMDVDRAKFATKED
ncbi:hypothetical protein GGI07_005801, partial [Coemansia sp. Benny D115]